MSYLGRHPFLRAPQSLPIPGTSQVPNSAGGYAWAVDGWTRLRRFLILGSEGGSYYASEATLTRESARAVQECLGRDGPRTVAEIVAVSPASLIQRETSSLLPARSPMTTSPFSTRFFSVWF